MNKGNAFLYSLQHIEHFKANDNYGMNPRVIILMLNKH